MSRPNRVVNLAGKLRTLGATPDRQSAGLASVEVADEAFVQSFEHHFRNFDVLQDETKVRAAVLLRNSIRRGAERQIENVVEMGRALRRAEGAFTPQEWKHLLDGGETLIGLPKSTASMYRAIAEALDSGRIPRNLCPPSYSVVYQLTCLTDWQLQLGLKRGLVRPTVTRREVLEFRRLPTPAGSPSEAGISVDEAEQQEKKSLVAREARLLAQLADVRGRLATLRERS